MYVIRALNVNYALKAGLDLLLKHGIRKESRNGAVIRVPEPVTTVYENPCQRVLWLGTRDANPIFHFLESLWMLAGRNDVKFPSQYAKQLAQYTDDGVTLNGAYGHRWKLHFGYDQLKVIINELKASPDSRRCVLQMWDGGTSEDQSDLYDATHGSQDVPCNMSACFEIQNGALNMSVNNRSNDAIWGAYGANAVHFSILQEYMAKAIGVRVGRYWQIANNFHVYIGRPDVDRLFDGEEVFVPDPRDTDLYMQGIATTPLFNDIVEFDAELESFFKMYDAGELETVEACLDAISSGEFIEPSIKDIALPMMAAHRMFKDGDLALAKDLAIDHIGSDDWKIATAQWFERRREARAKAAAPATDKVA